MHIHTHLPTPTRKQTNTHICMKCLMVMLSLQEWEVDGMIFRQVDFNIRFLRRPAFYVVNIILPCIALSLIGILALYLPSDCGEKISLEITVTLAFSVFLLLISDTVPRTSSIPILSEYITFQRTNNCDFHSSHFFHTSTMPKCSPTLLVSSHSSFLDNSYGHQLPSQDTKYSFMRQFLKL